MIKKSLKVSVDYLITLLIFGVFLYVFMSITGTNYSAWIPLYSGLFFLLLFAIVYNDFKNQAVMEKRPQYNLNPYPLKGLVYGFIGFSPVIIVCLVLFLLKFQEPAADRIRVVSIKVLMGPVYWIARAGALTAAGYIAAFLAVPVIVMLSYLSGFFGWQPFKFLKKPAPEKPKGFEKSPWNPSVNAKPRAKTKKKTSASGSKKGGNGVG